MTGRQNALPIPALSRQRYRGFVEDYKHRRLNAALKLLAEPPEDSRNAPSRISYH
ncbi:MAG: hypothetical protein ABI836_11745 [Gemmatimonadota bacterium]